MKQSNYRVSPALLGAVLVILLCAGCAIPPQMAQRKENTAVPESYGASKDTLNIANTGWMEAFKDEHLKKLINIALENNQELNIILQEINIAKNEIKSRKGEYLPSIGVGVGAGYEKVPRYTSRGLSDELTGTPDPLPDFLLGLTASWEIDIWKKLRNAKKAALYRYLSSVEGKNFMTTNLVAEIAGSYYELMALDNQLDILEDNIEIQKGALEVVKLQKASAKTTELAVRRFEAEVFKNEGRRYNIRQKIVETENRINFLLGRFPQPILRNSKAFMETALLENFAAGVPSQLLQKRPDIRKAELDLAVAKLDVKVARANFYPSLNIRAGIGYQAFNMAYLFSPKSLLYNVAGDLIAPLINRNAIKAAYWSASAKQVQAVYNYERAILNAYIEVVNQVSKIDNLEKSYEAQSKEVDALTQSIDISSKLFKSARADYMEVLLTQQEALRSKFELTETKSQQITAMIRIYRSLGGGWKK